MIQIWGEYIIVQFPFRKCLEYKEFSERNSLAEVNYKLVIVNNQSCLLLFPGSWYCGWNDNNGRTYVSVFGSEDFPLPTRLA